MVVDKVRTKIVCTIGPASESKEILSQMIEAGMDVVRLNLSHGSHADVKKRFELIREIDDTIPILFDLQGPKIRIGEIKKPTELKTGQEFVLSIEDFVGDNTAASISYKHLPKDVKPGDVIAVNDGIIRLRVKQVSDVEIVTNVEHGGPISSRKGVNVPGIRLTMRIPTEKDLKDLDLAAELEPDFIALSFVMDDEDIRNMRKEMAARGIPNIPVISKIEHGLAVKNYDRILKESYGIMIARGDLGIEVPIEQVPILQRELIRKANIWARPTIVATHMLESMTHEPLPTRAEVSDVAHAVFDRADAVMLSGETAVGDYPVKTVSMMNKIVRTAEETLPPVDPHSVTSERRMIVEIIGDLVYNVLNLIPDKVAGIITATRTGYTPRWISKYRPPANIFAVVTSKEVMRRTRILWGVVPVLYTKEERNVDDLIKASVNVVYSQGLIGLDKDIVFTSGTRLIPGRTNLVGVFHVKDLVEAF